MPERSQQPQPPKAVTGPRTSLVAGFRLCVLLLSLAIILTIAALAIPVARRLRDVFMVSVPEIESVSVTADPASVASLLISWILIAVMIGGSVSLVIALRLLRRRRQIRHGESEFAVAESSHPSPPAPR
ncbi:MAG: hypothetical protein JNG89_15525 [Planctomycetaceae bacterium]|nr:hypothetical protein [Planctomycetaceae bacterium]